MNEKQELKDPYPSRKTDKISNINICPLTQEEYMVYPRSRTYHERYLCIYQRILDGKGSVPIEKWCCYSPESKGAILQSRMDLGELFKWISEDIASKE